MKMTSLLLLILVSSAHAAPVPTAQPTSSVAPPAGTAATTAAITPPPAPTPIPWKLTYFGEYMGPRLSNFDLSKYQGPMDATSGYASWAHALKAGYAVVNDVVLGTQVRFANPFDPAQSLTWKNIRFYASWAHMIDTADVDMRGVLDIELPSSIAAKNNGLIMAFNLKNYWTFKTAFRNWNFSAMTMIRPMFYNVQKGTSDIYLYIGPSIQVDLAADWALLIDGNFDASHSYNDTYFDFGKSDPDYVNVGIQYTFNAHLQVEPALTFYPSDLSVPTLYLGVSAAL